jgi:hypothetical protein
LPIQRLLSVATPLQAMAAENYITDVDGDGEP